MKKLTVFALILTIMSFLPGCQKKSSQEIIPSTPSLQTQTVSGTLTLPVSSGISMNQIKVYSALSSTNANSDGTYKITSIINDKPQVILATNNSNKPVLLGYVLPGLNSSAVISVTTTAKALVLLNPVFMYTSNEQRITILNALDNNQDFNKLVEDITTLVQLDANNALDHSVHPTIYQEAAQLAKEVLQGLKSAGFYKKSPKQVQDNPWVEDAAGDDVIFKNPKTVYYAAEIDFSSNQTRKGLIILDAKSSLVSIQLVWPPQLFTPPTETKYSLGDGSFNVTMTKGFDFSVSPITNFFDLNTAHGQASLCNTAKTFLLAMDLLIGYYPTVPVTSLRLDLTQSAYTLTKMEYDYTQKDNIALFMDFLDLMLVNSDQICYWLWQDASTEGARIFASQLLEIMGGIDEILKGVQFVNEDVPFLYDLMVGDTWITLQLVQENGVLTTNKVNHSPVQPVISSNNTISQTNIPITFQVYSTDLDGDNISYRFHWGDGQISNWTNYIGSGENSSLTYSYSTSGRYLVTAEAKDILGGISQLSDPIIITINQAGTLFTYDFDNDNIGMWPSSPPFTSVQLDPSYLNIENSIIFGSSGNSCAFYDSDPIIGGNTANAYAYIYADVTSQSYGSLEFEWRIKSQNDWFGVRTWESLGEWETMGYYVLFKDGTISYYDNYGNFQEIMNIQPERWYKMKLVYNISSLTYDIYIDDALKISQVPFAGNPVTLNDLQFVAFSDANCNTGYVDNINLTGAKLNKVKSSINIPFSASKSKK